MPFFGILWVASWINCSISCGFPGSLITNYLSSAFRNKPLASISNPLAKPSSQTSQSTGFITNAEASSAMFPNAILGSRATLLTKTPISSALLTSSLVSSPNFAITTALDTANKLSPEAKYIGGGLKAGEESFCSAEVPPLDYSWANLPTVEGEGKVLLDTFNQGTAKGSVSYKIFQMLNSLFHWQDYFAGQPKINSVSVVVARSDSLMSQQARRNFWLLSQKSSENTLSDAPQTLGSPLAIPIPKFQVWLKRRLIAEFNQKLDADLLAQRLQQLVDTPNLDPQQLQPGFVNGESAVKLGDRLLFLLDDAFKDTKDTKDAHNNKELIAIKLTNSLRLALGSPALGIAQAQIKIHGLSETSNIISGLASWYGPYFHGRQTANGEIYDQHALTVAHPSLPFDTFLKVTNQKNSKSVIVRVNDRGPYVPPRVLDLSKIAAQCIDSEDNGVVMVEAMIMQPTGARRLEKK